jgi:hypothetical protein
MIIIGIDAPHADAIHRLDLDHLRRLADGQSRGRQGHAEVQGRGQVCIVWTAPEGGPLSVHEPMTDAAR